MAVISVPRELREQLGDAATDSLVDLLQQFGVEQREDLIAVVEERFALRVAESRDELRTEMHAGFDELRTEMHAGFDAVRTEMHAGLDAVRSEMHAGLDAMRIEMHAGFMDVQKHFLAQQQQIGTLGKEIGSVRADLGKEIGSVRADLGKEIGEVRKEITVQTRWLLTVLVAATILIPVMQRVLQALFP